MHISTVYKMTELNDSFLPSSHIITQYMLPSGSHYSISYMDSIWELALN